MQKAFHPRRSGGSTCQLNEQAGTSGVMSFTGTGHLNSLILLSQHLKDRGHKVTFFEKPKIEDRVRQAGLDFYPIGTASLLSKEKNAAHQQSKSALSAFHASLQSEADQARPRDVSPGDNHRALRQTKVDALLVNEIALTGPTVAQIAACPISSSPPQFLITSDGMISHGSPATSIQSRGFHWLMLHFLENSALRMRGPIRRALDAYRRQAGLEPVRQARKSFPELAHITQLPKCLDLPRSEAPCKLSLHRPVCESSRKAAGRLSVESARWQTHHLRIFGHDAQCAGFRVSPRRRGLPAS
jgi:zeaxanthin glucosyltransferase